MNAKEFFKELRLLIRDIGVLLSAMPIEAGGFEELEKDENIVVEEIEETDE